MNPADGIPTPQRPVSATNEGHPVEDGGHAGPGPQTASQGVMALDDAERRVRAAVVAMARGRVWEPNLTAFLTLYDHRGTEIERLRAAVAERDAEITRLRAAVGEAEELARDAIAECDRANRGVGRYEGYEYHQLDGAAELARAISRVLAAAPAPAEDEARDVEQPPRRSGTASVAPAPAAGRSRLPARSRGCAVPGGRP